MSKVKCQMSKVIIVFLVVFGASLVLQLQSPNLLGNDSYFYIKIAEMVKEHHGLFYQFPWLYFTPFRTSFYGLHWLYYVLLVPFTYLGNLLLAAKVATAFFFAGALTLFYFVARRLRFRHTWFGVLLVCAASYLFVFRMHLTRPLSLSLIFLLLGFYFILKKKYWGLFWGSFFYVWAYDGYIVLTFLCGLWSFAYFFAYKKMDLKPLLVNISGILWGNIINPYFPANVATSHLSHNPLVYGYFKMLPMSAEWQPQNIFTSWRENYILITVFSLTYIVGFCLFYVKGFKKRKKIHFLNLYFWITSLFFALLSAIANRFIEYWVPLLVLYFLFGSTYIVPFLKEKAKQIRFGIIRELFFPKEIPRIASILLLILFLVYTCYQSASYLLEYFDMVSYNRYQAASEWLKENSSSGEIVFNPAWDSFPFLFFQNTHNYYIVGLDPYFLYLYNKQLYFLYHNIRKAQTCLSRDCAPVCRIDQDQQLKRAFQRFKSNYILVDPGLNYGKDWDRFRELNRILKASPQFREAFRDKRDSEISIFTFN